GSACGFGLTLDADPGLTERIAELPEVHYPSETNGAWDAIGTPLCPSADAVADVLDRVAALPGVPQPETWMHRGGVKGDYSLAAASAVPSEEEAAWARRWPSTDPCPASTSTSGRACSPTPASRSTGCRRRPSTGRHATRWRCSSATTRWTPPCSTRSRSCASWRPTPRGTTWSTSPRRAD